MTDFNQQIKNWRAGFCVFLLIIVVAGGCGPFFEKQSTEVETRRMLDEIGNVKENLNIKNPLPELYRQPPQRLNINEKVKLFYFTKNHTVDALSNLVKSQMGVKVDQNPATNQLIIECKDDNQADETLEYLNIIDVPPIQVNIDCIVLQRFADVTMDWETKLKIEDILGEDKSGGGLSVKGKEPEWLAFPGGRLRAGEREHFGLNFGYLYGKEEKPEIEAIIDVLVSRGYMKILMNPSLETVNGQTATVTSMEEARHEKTVEKPGVMSYNLTEYVPVVDLLKVTPHVFADGSIGLETSVKLGAASKPRGVAQVSVITEQSVEMQENRIAPGDSLVIGGIRKSERRSVVRGVPFFKDLPIIGILFSSKDFEESATEIIFILTPTISSGGVDYAEMVEDIRGKHSIPKYKKGLEQAITDPFGLSRYSEAVEEKAAEAEFERLKSQLQEAQAKEELEVVRQKLLETTEKVLAEKQKAREAIEKARQAREEAEAAETKAEQAEAEAKKALQEAEKNQTKAKESESVDDADVPEAEVKAKEAHVAEAQTKAKESQAKVQKAEEEAPEAKAKPKKTEQAPSAAKSKSADADEKKEQSNGSDGQKESS